MSKAEAKHGTRAKWNGGCRCKSCVAAVAAYGYARYWRDKWDGALSERIIVTGGLTLGNGKLTVPKSVLIDALNHHGDAIKMTMLELLWQGGHKKGL